MAGRRLVATLWAMTICIGAGAAGPAPRPRIESTAASANWSGYVAASSHSVQSVSATWRVPDPGRTPGTRTVYSSVWVGIGGSNGTPLIQAGTEQDASCTVFLGFCSSRQTRIYFWYEIYPDVVQLPIRSVAVAIDDRVTTTVSYAHGLATFVVCNTSRHQCATVHRRPSAAPSRQAEWIVERPTENGRIATLANFGNATIAHARFTAGGVTQTGAAGTRFDMYSCRGALLASTSAYSRVADRFSVTWHGYGSVGC